MTAPAVWLARDFLRTAGRPIDIPPCQHPTEQCPPIREGAPMTEDFYDPCVPAELGVAHPAHAYSTAEPSGCPGYDEPAPVKELTADTPQASPTPKQLVDALTANGFTARNEGEDGFGPRGWTVWYPQGVNPTLRITAAPHTTTHALAELARAASNGRRAAAVLASLNQLAQP